MSRPTAVKTESVAACALLLLACGPAEPAAVLTGPVELVLLHSADLHAQLFPWRTVVGAADARRGLGESGELAEVGGFARLGTLSRRERAAAHRLLHLDSGDLFQGSLAFERFGPEPALLAFGALGVDAQALGNHELDHGAEPVESGYGTLAAFPLLAANYAGEGGKGVRSVVEPFVLLEAEGLRVGVIGVGNARSVALLRERPSELGVVALEAAAAVQGAIDALRTRADVIVALTHLGLDADEALVRATSGLDVVLGGHQHIVLDEPAWVSDCGGESGEGRVRDAWGRERLCTPRRVAIVHSGAYGKFLGKLTLELTDDPAGGPEYDPLDRHEIAALRFELLPARADTAEDGAVAALLEPYRPSELETSGASSVLGFAPEPVERNGVTGGDSPLGNFAAEAVRRLAQAEIAVIGASSLRHDLPPGFLDAETLARVLPFDDALVRVRLPGTMLQRAFEHAARSASARDCRTQ
ncbi:MAG TPA: 5'-nucleotidase C-terminal domain-containing protein, partial [Polyangiaceae bacterium]